MSGSYVDMMGDIRWTEADHVARVEATLRTDVTHTREHVLLRRTCGLLFYVLAQMLPDGSSQKPLMTSMGQLLTPAALAELTAAAQAFNAADALAAQARLDSALLDTALDYEDQRAQLSALPSAPTDGSADPYADQRSALQSQMSAASTDTTNLVSQRDAWRLANGATAPGQPIPAQ